MPHRKAKSSGYLGTFLPLLQTVPPTRHRKNMRDGKTRRERVERQFFSLRQKRACLLAPLLFRQRSGIANRRILSARQNFAVFSHSLLRSPSVRRVKNEVVPKKKQKRRSIEKEEKTSLPLSRRTRLSRPFCFCFSPEKEKIPARPKGRSGDFIKVKGLPLPSRRRWQTPLCRRLPVRRASYG